jgi:hypothetical protein
VENNGYLALLSREPKQMSGVAPRMSGINYSAREEVRFNCPISERSERYLGKPPPPDPLPNIGHISNRGWWWRMTSSG